jgi:hypothetical protein
VVDDGGVWGTRVLALVTLVFVYGLAWYALSSVRTLLNSFAPSASGRVRGRAIIGNAIRCVIAVGAFIWVLRHAIAAFPDWLGL